MSNTYCLLNCEGDILSIFFEKNKITAQALLDDGSGKVFFNIKKFEIIKYLHSVLTLEQLIKKSSIKEVEIYDYSTKSKSTISKKLIGQLACGNSKFNNLPWEMKMPFAKRIELAVRANHTTLSFKKVMEIIKHYFYLREKYELLTMTYNNNHPVIKQCTKQLSETRDYLFQIEIPLEFIHPKEIEQLRLEKVNLEEECGLNLFKIGQKDINEVTNKEMNYLVYRLSDLIVDLNQSPRFWNQKAKLKYIEEYKDHYYSFKRNIIIDNILN